MLWCGGRGEVTCAGKKKKCGGGPASPFEVIGAAGPPTPTKIEKVVAELKWKRCQVEEGGGESMAPHHPGLP